MTPPAESVRFIVDPPAAGPLNMARDEALLDAVAAQESPPTLRFYAWCEPTISLGYFQRFSDFQAQPDPVGSLPVVRRTTGGGAILHDLELTYSLVAPSTSPWLRPNSNQLYLLAHRAIIAALQGHARMAGKCSARSACGDSPPSQIHSQRAGPFFCFARRHEFDVVVPDPAHETGFEKIAGSAQRRNQRAVLQHGSLIIANRYPQHPCAAWSTSSEVHGFSKLADRLKSEFERHLECTLSAGDWTSAESAAAKRLVGKYAGEEWTLGCRN